MIRMAFEVNYDFDATKKDLKEAAKMAARETLEYWHKNFAEDHFKASATSKYNYDKRTNAYKKRKLKQKKTRAPLVYSGKMKEWFTDPNNFYVSNRSGEAVGQWSTPNSLKYVWMTPPKHPNKPAELTTATDKEHDEMLDYMQERTLFWLEKIKETRNKIKRTVK